MSENTQFGFLHSFLRPRILGDNAAQAWVMRPAAAASGELVEMDDVRRAYPGYDWADPNLNLQTFSRMFGTLEPGKIGYMYFFGRGVGTTSPSDYTPLFRLESIATSLATVQSDGAVHYKAGQIILFLDWNTGEVLDSWRNPYTNEVCEVFHYRDHPLGYTVDHARPEKRYTDDRDRVSVDPTADSSRGRPVTWHFRKNWAFGENFSATKIKTRLDPQVWRRESVGDYWTTFEHYQWQAKIEEIADPSIPQIKSFRGDFQTFKPWDPWMMMDQRPGKIFQQKTVMNIDNFDAVPRHVMAYVEKHMAQYLDLSAVPAKAFKLNDQHYQELRKPAAAPSQNNSGNR
ncbi:MAG: DUF1838 family protein [Rhodospirillaceae bacterium]|nr:DUF1838 family protein [Rhodospirillaceae bacterium]